MHENLYFKEAKKVTFAGIIINLILVFLKTFVGIIGKSSALLADGIHSLSDLSSDFIVLLGIKLSSKPSDREHKYGHGKYETFGNFALGVILFFAGIEILYSSLLKFFSVLKGKLIEVPAWSALIVAIISVLLKAIIFLYTISVGKRIKSSILVANAYHHLSDSISSVVVILGILGSKLLPSSWRFLDPFAAIILSFLIIGLSLRIVKDSFDELVEKSIGEEKEEKILSIIKSVKGVKSPHKLRTRKIGNFIAIDVHIRVRKELNIEQAHEIATNVEKELKRKFYDKIFVNIHIEPF